MKFIDWRFKDKHMVSQHTTKQKIQAVIGGLSVAGIVILMAWLLQQYANDALAAYKALPK
jgi:triacylglycerol esterase/lipase EstA (alpha/beta hydrolase family)